MFCFNDKCENYDYESDYGCSKHQFTDYIEMCPIRLNSGKKYDNGKTRWDLIPWKQFKQVADVLTYGAKKYDDENWKSVDNEKRRYFSASMRHLTAWIDGEKIDEESGKSHLAHAICCILFLMFFDDNDKN